MDFYLSYRGPLKATQRDPAKGTKQKTAHLKLKHEMRLCFHRQLQTVWETHSLLVDKQSDESSVLNRKNLANSHVIKPWSFVPLITTKLKVLVELEIVLLRLDHPGDSVWSGDIDNRVKTIIDALEVPSMHCGYGSDAIDYHPTASPLNCLLDTDRLITKVSLETGRLLAAPEGVDRSWAEVMIRVRATPENVTQLNIGF